MIASWFLEHGVGVFPLRDRGKEPAEGCKWTQYSCTPEQAATFKQPTAVLYEGRGAVSGPQPGSN